MALDDLMDRVEDAGYDVIGDVHGCADKLIRLLVAMGYERIDGVWRHRSRQAVFVGDFIDRGLYQLDAVAIPRAMVKAGSALAVLGNHEFNAVAYATKDRSGQWCRAHSEKNRGQTTEFLAAAPFGSQTHQDMMSWFRSLPLWLDLGGLQIVHACWHGQSMETLRPMLSSDHSMTDELIIETTKRHTVAYEALKVVLKGPEAGLDGFTYMDKDGYSRDQGRLDWWDPAATTLRNGIRLPDGCDLFDENMEPATALPNTALPDDLRQMVPTAPGRSPVLFGHYWFSAGTNNETLLVIDGKAACLDFSAVRGGPLVAYRWSGESELQSKNLVASY